MLGSESWAMHFPKDRHFRIRADIAVEFEKLASLLPLVLAIPPGVGWG